jgi:hypothetical protein
MTYRLKSEKGIVEGDIIEILATAYWLENRDYIPYTVFKIQEDGTEEKYNPSASNLFQYWQ